MLQFDERVHEDRNAVILVPGKQRTQLTETTDRIRAGENRGRVLKVTKHVEKRDGLHGRGLLGGGPSGRPAAARATSAACSSWRRTSVDPAARRSRRRRGQRQCPPHPRSAA